MYCKYCGKEINDQAVKCVHCGRYVNEISQYAAKSSNPGLETAVKIFLILVIVVCFFRGIFYWANWIPLLWMIPMTVSIFKKLNNYEPIGTGLKVCTLLFVNLIAGICLLCMDD